MKRLLAFILAFFLLTTSLAGCQRQFRAGDFIDDAGRVVKIDKTPQKIVSHVPSITETLFSLELEGRVAGVSDYCDFPEEAKKKPRVGNYFNPSVEKIVALEPDLVLTDGHSESIKRLATLGIPFLVIDPKDIDGILNDIELLGRLTGQEKTARNLINRMKQDIDSVAARVKSAPRVKALYVIDTTNPVMPWVAGPGSFIDGLINVAGGENTASSIGSAWAQMSIEMIVAADPEFILVSGDSQGESKTARDIKENPIWQGMTAVKKGNVRTIYGDLVVRSGPRITQGLKLIAQAIHPELFR